MIEPVRLASHWMRKGWRDRDQNAVTEVFWCAGRRHFIGGVGILFRDSGTICRDADPRGIATGITDWKFLRVYQEL
jgi:hypothetical protein